MSTTKFSTAIHVMDAQPCRVWVGDTGGYFLCIEADVRDRVTLSFDDAAAAIAWLRSSIVAVEVQEQVTK